MCAPPIVALLVVRSTFWSSSSNYYFFFLQKTGVQLLSAKLNFADLAGPECLKQTEATG